MKIKEIHIDYYGPYRNWQFTPVPHGLQVIHGANESGKTSLLGAMRAILFPSDTKTLKGSLLVDRGHTYTIGRDGKELVFTSSRGESYNVEPAKLWWHGLDKETYDRIFAITLDDLQGIDVLNDVAVRMRFFGAEGGDELHAMMDSLKAESQTWVSPDGTRKGYINDLLHQLTKLNSKIESLQEEADSYQQLVDDLNYTDTSEMELVARRKEWYDYHNSVELVLRAWDTYKRSEEAKAKMSQMGNVTSLDRSAFLELDEEIKKCQEHMRIWRGKEDGLVPENFDPKSKIGLYRHDIENLYEEVSKWTQLDKDCRDGRSYLNKVKDQLALARKLHSSWRNVEEFPRVVNWFEGERLARNLRTAKEAYALWQTKEPEKPADYVKEITTEATQPIELEEKPIAPKKSWINTLITQILGMFNSSKPQAKATVEAVEDTPQEPLTGLKDLTNHQYETAYTAWAQEGRQLEEAGMIALKAWQEWLPKEASQVLVDTDFFTMKEEYERYMESLGEYEVLAKRLGEHEERLAEIVQKAEALWAKLELTVPVNVTELRLLYNQLQAFKQNAVRYEQKEGQRQNYRDEYAKWSRKEKDLLLQQDELVAKAGLKTAGEYRQKLLQYDQYKQWETIYKQSLVQLELIAPKGDYHDLLYRRLQGDDKGKWEEEYKRSGKELASVESKLAKLYEKRGILQESMRHLTTSKEMSLALQKREHLKASLKEALIEWSKLMLVRHVMGRAQDHYEGTKRPETLAKTSEYIQKLTGGIYTLDIPAINEGIYLLDAAGNRVPMTHWSSGVGDQVYLALRLALAKTFGKREEPLPLILDDILVRFDEGRQRLALELLRDLAKEDQIFLFTCHESTFNIAQSIEDTNCYELMSTTAELVS